MRSLSIAVEEPSHRSSPSILLRGAVEPFIVEAPYLAIEEQSRVRFPSPSRSQRISR